MCRRAAALALGSRGIEVHLKFITYRFDGTIQAPHPNQGHDNEHEEFWIEGAASRCLYTMEDL
jgi:hypothetical protein